jgi:hypothetical protein
MEDSRTDTDQGRRNDKSDKGIRPRRQDEAKESDGHPYRKGKRQCPLVSYVPK